MDFVARRNLPLRVRAGVVIVQDRQVALIKRFRAGRTYYLFPGGGVEGGETREEAARREALEELGVHVEIDRLVTTVRLPQSEQYYYTATITGGIFGTGQGPEMDSTADTAAGTYTPVWVGIDELLRLDVKPRRLAEAIAAERLASLTEPLRVEEG